MKCYRCGELVKGTEAKTLPIFEDDQLIGQAILCKSCYKPLQNVVR